MAETNYTDAEGYSWQSGDVLNKDWEMLFTNEILSFFLNNCLKLNKYNNVIILTYSNELFFFMDSGLHSDYNVLCRERSGELPKATVSDFE